MTAKCWVACLLLLFSGLLYAADKAPERSIRMVANGEAGAEFQLEARQAPLAQVLNEIARKTAVPIHYSVVPEGLVTATCVGATLKQVIECLLARKADLIVRYPKSSIQIQARASDKNQPIEIWILGSRFTDTANCSGPTLPQQTISNSPVKSPDSQVEAAEKEPDQTDNLLMMAKSKDASVRADAIGALMAAGREGDANVKRALEEALTDPNANVRAQAISSLAHREGSAAIVALQDALHDTDAGVRLMAVDGAGNNIALLQQAVNDDDETVRNLAISKLEELQKIGK
ncbi:MAG: HEAT repeat domain-containing protein [Methylococcaceae bacterium]|nr:HEAT repeat domain-containing protein [Methylococcaceae bacterium]